MDRIKELKRGFRRNQNAIAAMIAAYQQTRAAGAVAPNSTTKDVSRASAKHSNEQVNNSCTLI